MSAWSIYEVVVEPGRTCRFQTSPWPPSSPLLLVPLRHHPYQQMRYFLREPLRGIVIGPELEPT